MSAVVAKCKSKKLKNILRRSKQAANLVGKKIEIGEHKIR